MEFNESVECGKRVGVRNVVFGWLGISKVDETTNGVDGFPANQGHLP